MAHRGLGQRNHSVGHRDDGHLTSHSCQNRQDVRWQKITLNAHCGLRSTLTCPRRVVRCAGVPHRCRVLATVALDGRHTGAVISTRINLKPLRRVMSVDLKQDKQKPGRTGPEKGPSQQSAPRGRCWRACPFFMRPVSQAAWRCERRRGRGSGAVSQRVSPWAHVLTSRCEDTGLSLRRGHWFRVGFRLCTVSPLGRCGWGSWGFCDCHVTFLGMCHGSSWVRH